VARRQHGVVTIAQLRAVALGNPAVVANRVRAGRLHRVHRGVYAVGHGGLSREGRWIAAVLGSGAGAVLSHLSAAVHWNLWRRRVTTIDVRAPRRRQLAGVRARRCRRLDPRDVTVRDGIPVTTVARTLVDLTDVLDAHQLANVIHEAAFRSRFNLNATREAMARANGRHHLDRLAEALDAHSQGSAGTKSANEDRFLALVRRAGLPEPLVNTHVQAGDRRIEVDFFWPELNLCVEVDGDGHSRPHTRFEDAARDLALQTAGHRVVRLAGDEVAKDTIAELPEDDRSLSVG
jgi:very-short-patch-repair endonuclease